VEQIYIMFFIIMGLNSLAVSSNTATVSEKL